MTETTEEAYVAVMRRLYLLGLRCGTHVTDYELAEMNAIRRVFRRLPSFKQHGCLVHHVMRVHEAVGRLGLIDLVMQNPILITVLRCLCALPRLPSDKIGEGFTLLRADLRHKSRRLYRLMYPLFLYYWNQWLVRVGPRRLSVYKSYHATNNNCESQHWAFRRHIDAIVPNHWDIVGSYTIFHTCFLAHPSIFEIVFTKWKGGLM